MINYLQIAFKVVFTKRTLAGETLLSHARYSRGETVFHYKHVCLDKIRLQNVWFQHLRIF